MEVTRAKLAIWHFLPSFFPGLGHIEIQVRSNQVRGQFLVLYLVRRTNFWVSLLQKILFAYTTDTFCGSLDT